MEIKYGPSTSSGVAVSYLFLFGFVCLFVGSVFVFFSPEIFLKLAEEINYCLSLG